MNNAQATDGGLYWSAHIESVDKSWSISSDIVDGGMSKFVVKTNTGNLINVDIKDYWFLTYSKNISNTSQKIVLSGIARKNLSSTIEDHDYFETQKVNLIIFSDGNYNFDYLESCSSESKINLENITLSEIPMDSQCGCWYYQAESEKSKKELIAVGDAGKDAIYLKINGKVILVDNWTADYQDKVHKINYYNDSFEINILSEITQESSYSNDSFFRNYD